MNAAVFLGLACTSGLAHAAPGAGTIDDPIVIDALPYFARGTTTGSASDVIDAYDCAPGSDESGGEVIYRFELSSDARVTAWLEGDDGTVDVDVHLLDDLTLNGTTATGCVARNNQIAEAQMSAGVHYLVVDSFDGSAQRGAYVLRTYAVGESWSEIPVGEGVVWRARRFVDTDGPQVEHVLDIDPTVPGVELVSTPSDGCQTVGANAASQPSLAVAGVNSTFFAFDGVCSATTFLKHEGTVLRSAAGAAFGVDRGGVPAVSILSGGGDFPEVSEAAGGRGMLVEGGSITQGADAWNAQGITSEGFRGVNPRTLAGYRADGTIVLATVDGRRANATGKTLDDLATFAGEELECTGAVNWDGGGSSTMWIAGMTPSGVVNYPSDGGAAETMEHAGARPSGASMLVYASPYNWAPRFQTTPGLMTAVGEAYRYDADVIDLDVDDVVTFSLLEAPEGMTIDAMTGELAFDATVQSPPQTTVTVLASDGHGGDAEQTWDLVVDGGMGSMDTGSSSGGSGEAPGSSTGSPDDGDGDSGEGATPGTDGTTGDSGGADAPDAGCGCHSSRSNGASGLLLLLLGMLRRRRAVQQPDEPPMLGAGKRAERRGVNFP